MITGGCGSSGSGCGGIGSGTVIGSGNGSGNGLGVGNGVGGSWGPGPIGFGIISSPLSITKDERPAETLVHPEFSSSMMNESILVSVKW